MVKRGRRLFREALICAAAASGAPQPASQGLPGLLQSPSQPSDNDAAGAVVGGGADPLIDIEHEFRHVIVPVQMRHRLGREPAPARHVDERGSRRRKLIDIVEQRLEQFCSRHDPLRNTVGEARDRRLFAVNEKHTSLDRAARRDPPRHLGAVRMAGILVDHADTRRHLDLVTLDPDRLDAVLEKPAQRAIGLIADQQHGRPAVPQPAACVTPAAMMM